MVCVKNDMVSMDWDVDGFVEDKRAGFICAIHVYHGVPVVFQEGVAYTFYDEQGIFSVAEIKNVIKKSYKVVKGTIKYNVDISEYSEYTLLMSGDGEYKSDNNLKLLGLTLEDEEDMLNRFKDLSGYYHETFVDF